MRNLSTLELEMISGGENHTYTFKSDIGFWDAFAIGAGVSTGIVFAPPAAIALLIGYPIWYVGSSFVNGVSYAASGFYHGIASIGN